MSILIKGMEMPTNCFECRYEAWDPMCPCWVGFASASEYKNKRHPDCPILEVPTPHGRLIDADKLKREIHEMNWGMTHYPDTFMDKVVHAPKIIEAEE